MDRLSKMMQRLIEGHGATDAISIEVRTLRHWADQVEEIEEWQEPIDSTELLSVTPARPTDYCLVTGFPDNVEAAVRTKLDAGWDLYGTPVLAPISADGMASVLVYQAMTRTNLHLRRGMP